MVSFYTELECDIEFLRQNIELFFKDNCIVKDIRHPTRYKTVFIFSEDTFNNALNVFKNGVDEFNENIRILCIKYGIKINFEVDVFRHIIRLKFED